MAEERPVRRIGAVAVLVGLLLTGVAVVASAAPVAAASNPGLVCNNQQNRPDKDCVDDKNHGTIATSFDTAGNLVFDLKAAEGFPGWRQIYICVGTGDTPTNSADCQGNTTTVLGPDAAVGNQYDVTDVDPDSTITEHAKDVSFAECATGITAVVKAGALPPGEFNWIVHVNSCRGTTDEAFGTATRPTTGDQKTYTCAAPTGVTSDAATLRATTTDLDVTAAEFSLTAASGGSPQVVAGVEDPDVRGKWSAAVTGLQPETSYTYDVRFVRSSGSTTAEDCAFATTKGPESYTCAAPTNVTENSATLRGSTTDETVDATLFELSSANGSTTRDGTESGDSNNWTASVTGLAANTEYTYTVDFRDAGVSHGTGSGAACRFKTLAASTTQTNPTTEQPTVVAGVAFTAPTPEAPPAAAAPVAAVTPTPPAAAAPAVGAAPLARTGVATDVLLPVGFGLVLFGAMASLVGRRHELALVRRPSGQHYR